MIKKEFLELMFWEKFKITKRIHELNSIDIFPGDDNMKSIDLHNLEVQLLNDQYQMIEDLINKYFE